MNQETPIITEEELNEMFPHIAGYLDIRREAAQIVDIVRNRELYAAKGSHCPRGWLFYGDPGMGKTRLVLDLAEYLNMPVIEISPSDALERGVSIEDDFHLGFKEAVKKGQCIVFIDELEKMAGYRRYRYEIQKNLEVQKVLLHELDKIKSYDGVIVIAACNNVDFLGDTVTRSGRFDRQIHFDKPFSEDRRAILKHFMSKIGLEKGVSLDEIVELTSGLSCADIETVVNEATIKAVSQRRSSLSLKDFSMAVDRVVLSDIPKQLKGSEKFKKGVAYHEAGHACVIASLFPDRIGSVSILHQGENLGNALLATNGSDDNGMTQTEAEGKIMVALAGFLSVKMMTGEYTFGADSDMQFAIKMVDAMIMNGIFGFECCDCTDYRFEVSAITPQRMAIRQRVLTELAHRSQAILEKNKPQIEQLAGLLLEKDALTSEEVQAVFLGSTSNQEKK